MSSLSKKAIEGIKSLFFAKIIVDLINFGAGIFVMRLLDPNDFGIIALSGIVIFGTRSVKDLGIGAALIQKGGSEFEIDEDIVRTGFTLDLFLSLLCIFIVNLVAPIYALLFRDPELVLFVRIMSLYFVFDPLGIPRVLLQRNMRFREISISSISSTLISTTLTLIFVILGFGVWSLIIGSFSYYIVNTLIPIFYTRWRFKLSFNKEISKELIKFGAPLTAQSITAYLFTEFDDAIVGFFQGTTIAGFYNRAYTLAHLPVRKFMPMVRDVTFSAFSRIKDDTIKLRDWYESQLRYVALLLIPISFAMFIFAEYFIHFFLTDKWMPMLLAFQIMCLINILGVIGNTSYPIIVAKGKTKELFQVSLLNAIVTLTLGPLLVYYSLTYDPAYGIAGMALATFISSFAGWIFLSKLIKDISGVRILKQHKNPFFASLFSAIILHFMCSIYVVNIFTLFLFIGLGGVLYIIFLYIIEGKVLFSDLKALLDLFVKS